jgi:hypothetical protein
MRDVYREQAYYFGIALSMSIPLSVPVLQLIAKSLAYDLTVPIVPPIFVRGDDLYIFRSVAHAESFIEPVDVDPSERAFDSQGRLLRVSVAGEVRRRTGLIGWESIDQSHARTVTDLAEKHPNHAEELRRILVDWLRSAGELPPDCDCGTLPGLVERVAKHAVT